MFRVQMLVIPFLLLTNVGLGQAGTSSDQETIRLLVQQVHELQDRVKALGSNTVGLKVRGGAAR